jgi:hypothetical protein
MSARYQVFISSTFLDLQAEREIVAAAVRMRSHIPTSMEVWPGSSRSLWQHIEDQFKETDYCVLLVGNRYGSIDPSTGKSWTEREYELAQRLGVPVIPLFAKPNWVQKAPISLEPPDRRLRLDAFKARVDQDCMPGYWRNDSELALVVGAAMEEAMRTITRPGWFRGGNAEPKQAAPDPVDLTVFAEQLVVRYDAVYSLEVYHEDYMGHLYPTRANEAIARETAFSLGELLAVTGAQLRGGCPLSVVSNSIAQEIQRNMRKTGFRDTPSGRRFEYVSVEDVDTERYMSHLIHHGMAVVSSTNDTGVQRYRLTDRGSQVLIELHTKSA